MSSYFIACCHPNGEAAGYDGLFYRACELDQLAKDLVDKPLLFNHEESLPLGKVITAWADSPSPGGKEEEHQVFALCEIEDASIGGKLAKRGIDRERLQDVSIGHTCKIDFSSGVRHVNAKTAAELSVCERGAREHTHIYGISWAPPESPSTYIKVTASADKDVRTIKPTNRTMSAALSTTSTSNPGPNGTPTPATDSVPARVAPATETETKTPEPKVELTRNVLAQLKRLQEENSRLSADLSSYQESSRKVREAEMNDGVRPYVESLIAGNPELANHKEELEALMLKMVDSEKATPLVKLLRCAAAKSTNSITALEEEYQKQKAKDLRIQELTAELEVLKSDAFALPEERAVSTVQVGASAGLIGNNKRPRTAAGTPVKGDLFSEISAALHRAGGANGIPTLRPEEFHMQRTKAREEFL